MIDRTDFRHQTINFPFPAETTRNQFLSWWNGSTDTRSFTPISTISLQLLNHLIDQLNADTNILHNSWNPAALSRTPVPGPNKCVPQSRSITEEQHSKLNHKPLQIRVSPPNQKTQTNPFQYSDVNNNRKWLFSDIPHSTTSTSILSTFQNPDSLVSSFKQFLTKTIPYILQFLHANFEIATTPF